MPETIWGELAQNNEGDWWVVVSNNPPDAKQVTADAVGRAEKQNGTLAPSYVQAQYDDAQRHVVALDVVLRKEDVEEADQLVADQIGERLELGTSMGERARRRIEAHLERAEKERKARAEQVQKHLEDVAQLYRKAWDSGRPDVNPYTHLPYHPGPQDRWQRPRHRTDPQPEEPSALGSGVVTLRLQVRTPLCVFGTEDWRDATHETSMQDGISFVRRPEPEANAHRVVTYRKDHEGFAEIGGASVKGAVRTWLEAITSSERRHMEQHVAWRATAIAADQDRAVSDRRIGRLSLKNGGASAALEPSTPERTVDGLTAHIFSQRMWWPDLELKEDATPAEVLAARRRSVLDNWEFTSFVDGATVRRKQDQDTECGTLKVGVGVGGHADTVSVHVVLGDTTESPSELKPERLRDWQAAHQGSRFHEAQGTVDGKAYKRLDPCRLHDGDLVWYATDAAGKVAEFGRIRQFRWATRTAIRDRVPADQAPPDDDQLSVAGRLMGRSGKSAATSWAGRLRFATAVSTAKPAASDEVTLTLRPLMAPKPSAAGFYLDSKDDEVSWADGGKGSLAGSKAYLHVLPPPDVPADKLVGRALDREGTPAHMASNTTVTALAGGEFTARIRFEDLTDDELGALLLACTLRFTEKRTERGLKLGLGKPLGMGSVCVDLVDVTLDDDGAPQDDPMPTSAREPLTDKQIETLLSGARERYLLDGRGHYSPRLAETLDAVARLDGVTRNRAVGYANPQHLARASVGGARKRQPNAGEALLEDKNLKLK